MYGFCVWSQHLGSWGRNVVTSKIHLVYKMSARRHLQYQYKTPPSPKTQAWGDGQVGKVPTEKVWGLGFKFPEPVSPLVMVAHTSPVPVLLQEDRMWDRRVPGSLGVSWPGLHSRGGDSGTRGPVTKQGGWELTSKVCSDLYPCWYFFLFWIYLTIFCPCCIYETPCHRQSSSLPSAALMKTLTKSNLGRKAFIWLA